VHVGLLTQFFPPEFEGGTEAVVLAQARALAARGHRVDVVCGTEIPLPRDGAEVLHDLVAGVRVHRLPRSAEERAESHLQNPLEIRPRLRDLSLELLRAADVVHVHHWANLDGSLVRAFATRTAVVVTLHDSYALCPRFFHHAPRGVACPTDPSDREPCARCLAVDAGCEPARLRAPLEVRASAFAAELGAARVLIAPSLSHAARFGALAGLPGSPVQVVPHGLCRPLARLAPAARPAPHEKLVVAHFGNLCADKGTLDLMRTLSLLPRERVELRVAGAPVDARVEAAFARHRRSNLVRMGAYDAASLRDFLAGSHLAAFPSRLEDSYGLVVDEALALGLPAWVSDRGAPPERLSAWGLPGRVLPAGRPLAWAAALRAVLAAPHALLEQRDRIPEALPEAADAVRLLEGLYEQAGARTGRRGAA